MTELTREYIGYAIKEIGKLAATYVIGFGAESLIPLPDMETRYAELGYLIGGAAVLARVYIDERRQK